MIRSMNEPQAMTTRPQSADAIRQPRVKISTSGSMKIEPTSAETKTLELTENVEELPGLPNRLNRDFLKVSDKPSRSAGQKDSTSGISELALRGSLDDHASARSQIQTSQNGLTDPAPDASKNVHFEQRASRMSSQISGRSPASVAPNSLKTKTKAKSILVIDDEKDILDFVDELLSFRFKVLKAQDASTGLELAISEAPDLIILDLGLQNQSGYDLCRMLRERPETKQIPVLIYTGSDDIDSLTQAFEQGADDYIVKTSRPRELVARVLAKIRRVEEQNEVPEVLKVGNLELDARRLEVTLDGRSLPLSVLEFNLLRFFVLNLDRVMTRTEILEGVWKGAVVSNRTIDTHMVYLRKKLKGFDHSLATVYGAGYILRAPSRR